jgi:Ca-activated chloride channel homolog
MKYFISLLFVLSTYLPAQMLMTEVDGKQNSLAITKMDFKVRTHGFLAETEVTMTFVNPFSRQLIGNFYLSLPQNSSITGYALDVNGKMIDAVAIEKLKARQVFEEISRQRIDPGLMEWVKGNYFKTRVYPIPAHGHRSIQIKILSELTYEEGQFFYDFPLNLTKKLNQFSLSINCINQSAKPKMLSEGLTQIDFNQTDDAFRLNTGFFVAQPKSIKFSIPNHKSTWQMIEKANDGKFYSSWASLFKQGNRLRQTPEKLAVIWDASASRSKAQLSKELDFLKAVLTKYKHLEVQLTVIRNKADKRKNFNIVGGQSEALINYLKDLVYDGGTYLNFKLIKQYANDVDEILVFSDGMSGMHYSNKVNYSETPLFVVNSNAISDQIFFKKIIDANGLIINLRQQSLKKALTSYFNKSLFYNDVDTDYRSDFYPTKAKRFNGFLSLVGSTSPSQENTISIKPHVDKLGKNFSVIFDKNSAVEGELLKKYYALKKLNHLLLTGDHYHILQHGMEYQMVTPRTSLIVLDNVRQYIQYRIKPPESLPYMREKYLHEIAARLPPEVKMPSEIDHDTKWRWRRHLAWNNRKFEYPEGFLWSREIFTIPDHISSGLLEIVGNSSSSDLGSLGGSSDLVGGIEDDSFDAFDNNEQDDPFADPQESNLEEDPLGDEGADSSIKTVAVKVTPWAKSSEVFKALESSSAPYNTYLKLRQKFSNSTDFYLDCAALLYAKGETALALRVVSNLSELVLDNATYLRAMAMFFEKMNDHKSALPIYQKLRDDRPDEPQSWRDLALCYEKNELNNDAIKTINAALKIDFPRFQIKNTMITELNRIALKSPALFSQFDQAYLCDNQMDLRIVLSWNSDNINLDLQVREPTGESLRENYSTIGGFREGHLQSYGPESYLLKQAVPGLYDISIKHHGGTSQSILGSVVARLDIFVNYGKKNEQHIVSYHKLSESFTIISTEVNITKNKKIVDKTKNPEFYIVSTQDNILLISAYLKSIQVPWKNFKEANKGVNWQELKAGMKLTIPKT